MEYFYKKELAEKRFQIAEPTKKRERETKALIKKGLKNYVGSIE
jgi:hypothetical protein